MANRLDLQAKFEEILKSRNVYYQRPASVILKYPAIVYSFKEFRTKSANNQSTYILIPGYEVTLITREPDPDCIKELLRIPYCKFDRPYISNNLYHYRFTIYN